MKKSYTLNRIDPKDKEVGRVYLVGTNSRRDPVKIGYSSSKKIEERLKSIQLGNWKKLKFLHISGVLNCAPWFELQLHRKYHDLRINGEWFKLTKKEIDEIKAIHP